MRRALVGTLVMLALAAVAAGAVEERAFQMRYRSASDALAVVEPLLTAEGTVLLQPRANTLVVRDVPRALNKAALALAMWDQAPFTYRITVKLYLASTAQRPGWTSTDPAPELGPDFSDLFHFTSYTVLDELAFVSQEGSSVEASAGERYTLRFKLRTQPGRPERVVLNPFELVRRHDAGTPPPSRPVVRSTVNLQIGQTVVLAAARSEQAGQVLLAVVKANREGTN